MSFTRTKMFIKKNAPDICIGLGIVGYLTGTVMACIQSTKVNKVMDEHKEQAGKVHLKNDALPVEMQNTKKELTKVYTNTAIELAKLYLPSGLIIGGSTALIIGSHKELKSRNRSLAAAYATLDGCFKAYRSAVKNKYGDAVDTELRFGLKKNKEDDNFKGKDEKKLEKENLDFSFFYDETSTCWEPDPEYRKLFVKGAQNSIEKCLVTDGIVNINDIRRYFDLPPIRDGFNWGLYYDKNEDPERMGPKVDLGVFEIDNYGQLVGKNKRTQEFVDGVEQGVLINPENIVWVYDKY